MSPVLCLFVIGLAIGGVTSKHCTLNKGNCVAIWKPEKCDPFCTDEFEPVCDSEGKTHGNICKFNFAQCKARERGKKLTIEHEGPCKDIECSKCQVKAVARCMWDTEVFVPKCDETDDSFAKTQYHEAKNESFCVTKNGQEIPESRVTGTDIDCSKFPDTLAPSTIPVGFTLGPKGIYYKAHKDHAETFDRATEICEEEGGVLARVYDEEDNDHLWSLMGPGWIAATDRRLAGVWETPDERCLTWTHWDEGHPHTAGSIEHCVEIGAEKKWNDTLCSEKRDFTCQFFPEGTEKFDLSLCEQKKCEAVSRKDVYTPDCAEDGYFKDVQCAPSGWCWCMQPNGAPLPNTFYRKGSVELGLCPTLVESKPGCLKWGYERFVGDCNRYFRCAPRQAFHCTCDEGLFFNFEEEICDYEKNVFCPMPSDPFSIRSDGREGKPEGKEMGKKGNGKKGKGSKKEKREKKGI